VRQISAEGCLLNSAVISTVLSAKLFRLLQTILQPPHVTILDESIDRSVSCKLPEFNSWVLGDAFVGVIRELIKLY